MADPSTSLPLSPASITTAAATIAPYIHTTPLIQSTTLNEIANSASPVAYLSDDPPTPTSSTTSDNSPRLSLHFKLENLQRIGAFKARGAFHAVSRLQEVLGAEEVRRRGVVTHSSGNHAQALALAGREFGVPSYIVMPTISTSSKIAGTKRYATEVVFSGSTSVEREEMVGRVIREKGGEGGEGGKGGPILVPPYDHPDIILGQGTVGREIDLGFREWAEKGAEQKELDAVVAPIGGGGLLGGIATWFSDQPGVKVFGAEPSFQGADDARRGLKEGKRIESVKTLTIADGLRTPVGVTNWGIVSDPSKVEGIYSVTEEQIKMAMRLVWERMKYVVEPSGCVSLAVVLFNAEWRRWVAEKQREEFERTGERRVWEVAVVFSGGNTTMKAVAELFGEGEDGKKGEDGEREAGKVGLNGERVAENVAG